MSRAHASHTQTSHGSSHASASSSHLVAGESSHGSRKRGYRSESEELTSPSPKRARLEPYQPEGYISEPESLSMERQARRYETSQTPIRAHPQLTITDPRGRQIHAANFPIDSHDRSDPARVRGHSTEFEIWYHRNPDEQRVASMPFNVFAPATTVDFHGSHSGQHGTGGDSSRVNMTPVAGRTNIGAIGGFEREQAKLRPDLSGQIIDTTGEKQPRAHQRVTTGYDSAAVLPRLIEPESLQRLSEGTQSHQAMAGAIQTQAEFIPSHQKREMWNPEHTEPATHEIDVHEILGQSQDSKPRYSFTSVTTHEAQWKRLGRPTGDPKQYRTNVPSTQQMDNELLYVELLRTQPEDHPHRIAHRDMMTRLQSGEEGLRLGHQQLDHVSQTAQQNLPQAPSGRSRERELEELRAEAQRFASHHPYKQF